MKDLKLKLINLQESLILFENAYDDDLETCLSHVFIEFNDFIREFKNFKLSVSKDNRLDVSKWLTNFEDINSSKGGEKINTFK